MEKNNNSLLYAILGGVVTCFICLGLVFMFSSSGTKNLKGNEEINLGMEAPGVDGSGGGTSARCYVPSEGCTQVTVSGSTCNSSNGEYSSRSNCIRAITCNSTTQFKNTSGTKVKCDTCDSGQKLKSYGCQGSKSDCCESSATPTPTPDGGWTCINGHHNHAEDIYCTECGVSKNATPTPTPKPCSSTNCGACGTSSTCATQGCYWNNNTCSQPTPAPTPTCEKQCENAGSQYNYCMTQCTGKPFPTATPTPSPTPLPKCPAGQGADSSASSGCSNCAAGYYSPADDGVCHACEKGQISNAGAAKCSDPTAPCCVKNSTGSYTQYEETTACQQAVKGGATVTPGKCPMPTKCAISISTVSVKTSEHDDKNENSYYTVVVNITGQDCKGQTATFSARNGKVSTSSYTISSDVKGTLTTSFVVRPYQCGSSYATATLSNGSSATSRTVTIQTDWKSSKDCYHGTPEYTSFSSADAAGADEYWSNSGTCSDGTSGWTVRWTRGGCGGSSGSKTTPTPKPGETPKVPYCYIDDNGEYQWTSEPGSSWKKVEGITSEFFCAKDETPACYLDTSNNYVWGLYAKTNGYTLITAINYESDCHKPDSTKEYACYKIDIDGNTNYIWGTEAPNGYTKVTGVTDPLKCGDTENPACYLHDNKFVWGSYGKLTGYIKLEDITKKEDCNLPENDACYVDSNGNYVWGKYANTSGYTIIPSVTELSQCNNEIPTPSTGISTSKLVYIFMAILMAFGIGFIYYSSVMKKNNQ